MNTDSKIIHGVTSFPTEKTETFVTIENGCAVICGNYHIELSRIPDERGLCEWIHHLSEKGWVTGEIINEFIQVVFNEKKWVLYKHL